MVQTNCSSRDGEIDISAVLAFFFFFKSEIILLEPGGKAQSRCSYYIVNKGDRGG
jgi:hypothetical protein